jgi:membrane protein YdbS with pleckstrin-like domain
MLGDTMMLAQERPHFVGWIALLAALPMQLFMTVWAGGFFGGLTSAVLGSHGRAPFIFFGALAFVGVPCLAYFGKKLNYQKTVYSFHDDHLDFEEGFFSYNKKLVRYRDVVEVTLRKGILQRSAGLGTIYLGTGATGSSQQFNPFYALGFGNISASGIGIQDVRDPDAAYERIRKLVDDERRGQT